MSESGYFAVIPGWLLSSPGISDGAKLFYGEVSRRCNERGYCWASNETLATDLHCGARTISRYVSELEDAGAICTEKVGVSDRKRRIERRIRLAETCGFNLAKNGEVNVAKNGEPNLAKNGETNNMLNNNSKNNPPIIPQGDFAADGFELFWAYYRDTVCAMDHNRAGNKGKAKKAWDKLGPDRALLDRIAAYLMAQIKTDEWRRGIGIPHASSLLNAIQRGEYDLTPPEVPQAGAAQRPPDEPPPQHEEDMPL